MAKKKYLVREGYTFTDSNKEYAGGETLVIDEEIGDAAHQLELVGKNKAAPVVEPVVVPVEPVEPVVAVDGEVQA